MAQRVHPFDDPSDIAYRAPLPPDSPFPPAGEVSHAHLKELLCRSLSADALIADVGCGPGPFQYDQVAARFAAFDAFEPTDWTGFRREYDEFHRVRLETFPLADASADAVLMGFLLEHVTRPEVFLMEAARVLKPGGWCYIAVPNGRCLEDWLFRLATMVAGSARGPHIQRFTFRGFVDLVEAHTRLQLTAYHMLPASYLWMNHPRLRLLRRPVVGLLRTLRAGGLDTIRASNFQFLFRKP